MKHVPSYFSAIPSAITSKYIVSYAGEPTIQLCGGSITLVEKSGATTDVEGQILLDFMPSPRVEFTFDYPLNLEWKNTPHPVSIQGCDLELAGYIHSYSLNVDNAIEKSRYVSILDETETPQPDQSSRVIFHLVNFHDFSGLQIRSGGETSLYVYDGRLVFADGEWEFTVDKLRNYKSIFRQLKERGGYAITHVGRLNRVDGAPFSHDSANELIEAVVHFLALLRGAWVGPVLISHYSPMEQEWFDVRLRLTSQWRKASNWFPKSASRQLGMYDSMFSDFVKKWIDPLWKQTLQQVIYWYVVARETHSVETRLILVSTAFELLFYTHFVEDLGTTSNSQAKNKNGRDMLQELLDFAGVSTNVPERYPSLRTAFSDDVSETGQLDGPSVLISRLRNKIVHPKRSHLERLSQISPKAKFEASELALFYLEELLLSLLDYSGPRGKQPL